jgi:HSP20 family protein
VYSLMPWAPFRGLMSRHGATDRVFGSDFVRPRFFGPFGAGLALDMYETEDELVVKATMPGAKPEDIEISVLGDVLTIKGEVKVEKDVENKRYVFRERSHGKFSRTVTLPREVEADKAEAEFEHGMLTLTIPKCERAKSRSIEVKVK